MARTRKISADAILDAAQRVVVRSGAAALSIDAVAREAGVSKWMVVYDHKSKSALLNALIERHVRAEAERQRRAVTDSAGSPHPELFGRIALARRSPDEVDKAVALAISASMSGEEDLQRLMRDWTTTELDAMAQGPRPKAALMAYLALSGFYCTELFGFNVWSEADRVDIIDGIRNIYASLPE